MLVVKVEIWPNGDEAQSRKLGSLYIGNVGGDLDTGIYEGWHWDEDTKLSTSFHNLRHVRDDGFWTLIRKALDTSLSNQREESP